MQAEHTATTTSAKANLTTGTHEQSTDIQEDYIATESTTLSYTKASHLAQARTSTIMTKGPTEAASSAQTKPSQHANSFVATTAHKEA